jgi:hypothetical protein
LRPHNRIARLTLRSYLKFYYLNRSKVHLTVIILVTLAAFWRVTGFSFLNGWDDQWFVTNHYTEDGLNWNNVLSICKDYYRGQYAPLNQLYYSTLYALIGYKTSYFHIGSVAIHLANAILVYFFLRKISYKILMKNGLRSELIAFFATVLFVTSPFNLESVAWTAASKVLIYALCYLIALLVYCKYLESKRSSCFYLTILFFMLSFGAKEQAVTLPFAILLLDFVYERDLLSQVVWLEKVPFFILSVFFGVVTLESQNLESTSFYSVIERVPLASFTLFEYLTKTIFPVNLSFLYPFPFLMGERIPFWMWIYPVMIPLTGWTLAAFFEKRWLAFGMAFFIVHIALVTNVVCMARFSLVADRYAYLSTIGIYFVVSFIGVKIKLTFRGFKVLPCLIVLNVGLFILYTNIHSVVWRDVDTLKYKIRSTIGSRTDFKDWKERKRK